MPFAIIFVVACGVTAALVPLVMRLSHRWGWLAQPGPRHVHRVATPTVGGIAMWGGFVAALALSFVFTASPGPLQRLPSENLRLLLLVAGASLVWFVATIDDIRPLPAAPRLALQAVAALIAVGPYLWQQTVFPDPEGAQGIIITAFENPFGGQIHLANVHPLLAVGFTLFWIMGMTNTVNWIDGLDGLAASVTLIAALVLALHTFVLGQFTLVLLPLMLAGVCAGFLPFNFHPARIFMGDGGAMVLGYILAITAIIGGAKLATALLVMGIPILDVAWLILYRRFSGKHAMASDRQHLHHRLYDLGWSQRQITAFYTSISATFGAIGLLIPPQLRLLKLVALGALVLLLAGVLVWATRARRRAPASE